MRALFIVDLQNDFCEGGALPVTGGKATIPYVNELMKEFARQDLPILASLDWHPPVTPHFKKDGGMWPEHCVHGSTGASFAEGLREELIGKIFFKGTEAVEGGYSAFDGASNGKKLVEYLNEEGIDELYVVGLATDYCVKATVLDALKNGFKVVVGSKGIAAVNIKPTDGADALQEMSLAGAKIL